MNQKTLSYYAPAPQVLGLDSGTQSVLDELWAQWVAKMPRNWTRTLYLDAKNQFKDLEVSLPPSIVDKLNVVFGWAEKSVYELSNRIVLESITSPEEDSDPFGLKKTLHRNQFWAELRSATASSLAYSTVFVSVSQGDVSRREPEELVMFHSALYATGLWDNRLRDMTAALIINKVDALGTPTQATLMLPQETLVMYGGGGRWVLGSRVVNPTGRLLFHQLPYRPTLDRPFGKSRIDRPTMSLMDRAVRSEARLDVHSELFMMVKLMLMGAGQNTFLDADGKTIPLWSFMAGRVNGIPKDEDGDIPKLEVIQSQSPDPHIKNTEHIASIFSGHTGVPLRNLGVTSQSNPESADAQRVGREDIVNDAENQQLIFDTPLRSVFEDIVMLREGLTEPPPEMLDLALQWRRPDRISLAALADAGAKQVASGPDALRESEVGMEMLGMSRSQIERFQSEKRRSQSGSLLDRVLQARAVEPVEGASDGDAA